MWYTTLHRLNNCNSQYFNHYPFLNYVYVTYMILTGIKIIVNYYGLRTAQPNTFEYLNICIPVIITP